MQTPLISIITPTYNSAATLPETAESVLAQSFTDWEWIIADDASTDQSRAVIERLADRQNKIKAVYLTTKGSPVPSREAALREARGRFVAFLDADDVWMPGKLERQLSFMLKNKAALGYTAYRRINEDGSRTGGIVDVPSRLTYQSYLKNTAIACSTVMIDRGMTGDFDLPAAKHQDFAIWLAVLKRGFAAHGLRESLMHYRVRKNSASANKWQCVQNVWSIYRQTEKLNVPYAAYCLANYGLNAVLKRVRF